MSETTTDRPGSPARRRTGHEEAWDLLPWYVNGTLEGEELRGVEEHLELCGICREEVRYWRECSSLLAEEDELALSPDAGLARLRDRVHRGTPALRERVRAPRRWPTVLRTTPHTVRWAMAAQMAAIAILAGWLATTRPAPSLQAGSAGSGAPAVDSARGPYYTLADPTAQASPTEGLLRVVFGSETREREIRGALIAVGGRIVAGPSPTGVYTVRVETTAVGEVVETLKSFPQIVLAERAATLGEGP